MQKETDTCITNNKIWAKTKTTESAQYFETLAKGQSPHTFFIGCCDSRVPFEVVTGSEPGDIFVYRNIANQADTSSDSFLASLDYAINVLGVKTIMVCGHTHCGGVNAALSDASNAELESSSVHRYVEPIRETRRKHEAQFSNQVPNHENIETLAKLNVGVQIQGILETDIYQTAKANGQAPEVLGSLFRIETGELELL